MNHLTLGREPTILIDDRERRAGWRFDALPSELTDGITTPTKIAHLKTGDYTLLGLDHWFAIERKSLSDLYGTLTGGRERFALEMNRLAEMHMAFIIVEAGWRELCNPQSWRGESWVSQAEPISVWNTIAAWSYDYPTVHWILGGDKAMAEMIAFARLQFGWKRGRESGAVVIDGVADPCEWNLWDGPARGEAAHGAADLVLGADGQWRLCEECAGLKKFKRLRKRSPIERKESEPENHKVPADA